MNPVERLVRDEIERSGPITVAAWMDLALNHPEHGYYRTRRPIGAGGDFTTAPEISQMFGELLAAWVAALDLQDYALVEIGPGRGTLAADIVRTLARIGQTPPLHLIETSPSLRGEQRTRVEEATWHETFEAFAEAQDGPFVLVANELLDAIPAHQFVRIGGAWRERMIAIEDDRLALVAGGETLPLTDSAPEGTIIEIAPAREALVGTIASTIAERGGAALYIDYGSLEGGTGDTLQAVAAHRRVDPLTRIGEADITTHVDFAPLATIAAQRGCASAGTAQGAFLLAMGLLERAGRLGHARPDRQERLRGEVERLAAPDAMGELFKVMALWHPSLDRPPGFDEAS